MVATTGRWAEPWPLTGRREALEAACEAVRAGCPAYFLIGAPGSGKTRLAREILARLEDDGRVTARVIASESARQTPLAALAHLIPAHAADDPVSLFQATRDELTALGAGRALVVHVDDGHHLDASSAALLVPLAEAGVVQLVVALREGALVPDSLVPLRSSDAARSVVVDSLDAISVDTLLHRVLGTPLDGAAEAQLLETSRGNPLVLRELVLAAVADGTLHEVSGVWRLDGALAPNRDLADRVLGRVESLGTEARDALEALAVAEPVGLDDLESAVDAGVLETLESRGLIRVEPDGRRNEVRLGHPVYGEVLRAGLGRLRLRRLARAQVQRVDAHGARRRGDPLRIARWQIDAGVTPDARVVLAGARVARHNHDWISTETLARAALAGGSVEAAPLLAEALFELGEFAEIPAIVDAALASGPDADAFVHLTRVRAMTAFWAEDRADDALRELAVASARMSQRGHVELLQFSRASLLAWSGRPREALALAEPLLASPEPRVAVQAALLVELAAATIGPTGRAVELADEWFPRHLALPDRAGTNNPGNHILTKTVALTNAGRLAEAQALAELGYGASVANRSTIGQMWFALEQGRLALMRGDARSAERWLREQVALCRGTGHRRPATLGLAGLAIARAYLGDATGARAAVADLDASGTATIELFASEAARARGWALAASGDVAGARLAFVRGADAAEERGVVVMAALARFDALRLGDRMQREQLRAAAAQSDSRVVELAAEWASAVDDAPGLETVSERFEALGCLMFAAEAAAAAAQIWRADGDPRRAAAAERRAEQLAELCDAATPALASFDGVVPLTPREREVAMLAAQGLTSKDVARRLFLSVRTVSNHLQNVYTKLGISRRADLVDALGRYGTVAAGSRDPAI